MRPAAPWSLIRYEPYIAKRFRTNANPSDAMPSNAMSGSELAVFGNCCLVSAIGAGAVFCATRGAVWIAWRSGTSFCSGVSATSGAVFRSIGVVSRSYRRNRLFRCHR